MEYSVLLVALVACMVAAVVVDTGLRWAFRRDLLGEYFAIIRRWRHKTYNH